jgi:hypothetical protein
MKQANRTKVSLFLSVLAAALVGVTGCDGERRPDGFPPLYPVTLYVTQEGKPLEGAAISLVTPDGSVPWVVGGVTDAEGKVKMKTHGKFDGAPAGNFNVLISKTVYEGYAEYMAALNRGDLGAARRMTVNVFQCVEDAYTSLKDTPLHVEVTKSTKVFEVDAGQAVKIKKPFMK